MKSKLCLSPSPVIAVLWVLSLIPAEAFAVDQITRRSDRVTYRGEFTEMTIQSVKIRQTNGTVQEIPVSDIYSVRFTDEPAALSQAQSNERSGAFDVALLRYQDLQKEYRGDDRRLATELEFLIARTLAKAALANPAKKDEALAAIQKFRESWKTNFRYLESTLLEAQLLATDSSTLDAARLLLQEVEAGPVKGFQLQAGVQLGRLLLQAGDAPAALTAFERVAVQSENDAAAAGAHFDALLGKAMCQQKQGQTTEAIATLDEVISKASESQTQTLAEAWVLKGDCFRLREMPKDALWAYLTVDVLYPSEPSAHAESLFHLASLWAPAGHQDRADDARQRLIDRYPNSKWAKQPAGSAP